MQEINRGETHCAARMNWSSLWLRRSQVFAITLIAIAFASAYLALRTGQYTAASRVLVDNRVLALAQQEAVYSTSSVTPQLMQSQVEVLRSENLAQRVIEQQNLLQSPDYAPSVAAFGDTEAAASKRLRRALDIFKKRLSVDLVGSSHVIEVRMTSSDPQHAARIVNALVTAYLEDQVNANTQAAQSASGWLRSSMRNLGTSGRVLSTATAPLSQDGPPGPLILAFAAFCGLFGGIGVAFLGEYIGGRVRTGEDVRSATGLPLLAIVPGIHLGIWQRWRRDAKRRLLSWALERPRSAFALSIRRILAAVEAEKTGDSCVLGIAGITGDEGSMRLAVNMARLAARKSRRVLLIDLAGRATDLNGCVTEDANSGILTDAWSGLDFAPANDATEQSIADLVRRSRRTYDLIIAALPSLQAYPDGASALRSMDAVVLVAQAGSLKQAELTAIFDAARGVEGKALGLILNNALDTDYRLSVKAQVDDNVIDTVPLLAFAPAVTNTTADQNPVMTEAPPKRRAAASVGTAASIFMTVAILLAMAVTTNSALAESYKLGTGDRMRIKVSEWPDLTGEYAVGANESISLPIVGEIRTAGLTATELANEIAVRLRDGGQLAKAPTASVEIVAYRPFFIMGDVQKPGEYAYRPGLNVLQAISIANGYYRPQEAAFRLERDAISARGDIARETLASKRIAARIARLEAENVNAASIKSPPQLDATPGSSDQMLIVAEQGVLTANRESMNKLLASLDHYKMLYEQEIVAIGEQIAAEQRQAKAVQTELSSVKELAQKGLSPLTRQLTTERTIAQISGTIQGLQATILRARQNIGQTEQRRIEALAAWTTRINDGLQQARAEGKEVAERLRTARHLLTEAQVTTPNMQADGPAALEPRMTISRPSANGMTDLQVDRGSHVLPGDVLTVERRLLPNTTRYNSADQRDATSALNTPVTRP